VKYRPPTDAKGARAPRSRARPGFGLACALAVVGHGLVASVIVVGVGRDHRSASSSMASVERSKPLIARIVVAPASPARPPAVVGVTRSEIEPAAIAAPGRRPPVARPAPPGGAPKSVLAKAADAASPSAINPGNPADPADALIGSELSILPLPRFWPTSELEIPPLPRSEPDATHLTGALASGLPIRLRLYIDAVGAVANIEILQASEQDADVVDRMKKMFYETRFLAGRRTGADVASYMDIEVRVDTVI
jgi:hypothetical protein